MSYIPRKSSIQPRPTKASMLRLQKQQASASGLDSGTDSVEEPTRPSTARKSVVSEKKPTTRKAAVGSQIAPVGTAKSRAASSALNDSVGATAGVKAFMAQQRARFTKPVGDKGLEEEPVKKRSNVMTGAQRYGGGSRADAAQAMNEPRKIQVVINQAKSSGKLDISSRGLTKIPEEVLKMYHVDPNSVVVDFTSSGDAWYDSVELTKIIAGDNAITEIDDRLGSEFGALKQIDFRDNKLKSLPNSLALLQNLTSVQMPYNDFTNIPDVLLQLKQLKELNLSHNKIGGNVILEDTIEQLDLSYNEISGFEPRYGDDSRLVKLNLSHNQIDTLPSSFERWTKLQELLLNQNKLRVLFPANSVASLPALVRLDAGNNFIATISEKTNVSMPKLIELSLMTNKLQEDGLAGLHGAPNLHTLDISSNQLQIVPLSVTSLLSLQRLDVRGNQLHALPYELGKLDHLKVIQCEGNPMRTFASMNQTQLIASLRQSYYQQLNEEEEAQKISANQDIDINNEDAIVDLSVNFTQKVSLTMKLDLSRKKLTELPRESLNFTEDIPGTILLDHNEITLFPSSLSLISSFIVHLNLEHNRMTSFNFTMDDMVFSNLKILKLNNNRLKSIECNEHTSSSFPKLEELVLSHNALTVLPENLAQVLPNLKILLSNSNKLDNITDQSFGQRLETLDLSNNDIGYLPPGLSAVDSLKELIVFGNRFRVPRPNVVEQGTKAIMEFLKRRHNASN